MCALTGVVVRLDGAVPMTWPNFIMIGAGRVGSTSLWNYLQQHPGVFLSPVKEPRFFGFAEEPPDRRGPNGDRYNRQVVWRRADYEALFDAARPDQPVRGEMSQQYLYLPGTAERMHALVPDARLLAVLRDPAERAFSQWRLTTKDGNEPLSFEAALDAEPSRIAERWPAHYFYRDRGFYAEQLRRFYAMFPVGQIMVLLYDELAADAAGTMARICRFLDIDPTLSFDVRVEHNVARIPRSRVVHRVVAEPHRAKELVLAPMPAKLRKSVGRSINRRNVVPSTLAPSTRARLIEGYRADIEALADLTDRDLSSWLAP